MFQRINMNKLAMKKYIITFAQKIILNMSEHFKQLLEIATSQGNRTNVVKPILIGFIVTLVGAIAGVYFNSAIITEYCLNLSIVLLAAFLIAYFVCLYKNPDLLRSEKYNLEKTALEKATFKGDSTVVGHINLPNKDFVVIEGQNQNLLSNNSVDSNNKEEKLS
jgi:undecaprenyl pyrophosphate phosphatase UppP